MDQDRRRNHPPQPRQLMSLWGKKKRTEYRRKNKKKETEVDRRAFELRGWRERGGVKE